MQSKQKTLHRSWSFHAFSLVFATLCISSIVADTAAAQQKTMVGTAGQISTLRLIAQPGLRQGRYEAGVDLTMAPGSHTYWQIPGESGVPPVFAFNGSKNVAKAEVAFPVPSRISEGGIEAYGYLNQVVFPVTVTPEDPGKPSELHLDMTYAVCNKICIPGHGDATLELAPTGPSRSGEFVAAARAKVPQPASAEQAGQLEVTPDAKAAQPSWTVAWKGAMPPSDVFAVAPEGYYFETKKLGPDSWTLTAEQSVSTTKATTVPVSLVLARDGKPLTVTRTLDVGPPSR